ncbi:MAG TPA: helix-turn-helix domain-containing protein [Patescibacteria group bacterium]|nr:helix-turn-helix domain-containing protein [Patescibacteria group bacterium]
MPEPEYLTAAEAAARLGISLRTARRRIADGSLASVRIGRAVRIPAAALELPVARPTGAAAREAVAPYAAEADEDRAAYVARWNASHWPDTFERMLQRRRRAFDRLDAIRVTTKPPGGPHDTVDAIMEAADREWDERIDRILPPSYRKATP